MIDTKTPTTFAFQPAGRDEPVNIRTAVIDGEPWFVSSDVCRALGLRADAAKDSRIAANEQRLLTKTRGQAPSLPGLFQGTDYRLRLLSESGLYKLIMRSDKKEALAFQHWLAATVLPSIRKTGGYLLNEAARETAQADNREAMPLPMDIAEALSKFSAAQEETNRLLQALLDQSKEKPKAERYVTAGLP